MRQKNQTDAFLLDRTNHTGIQAISTVDGLQTELDKKLPVATDGSVTVNSTITSHISGSDFNWKQLLNLKVTDADGVTDPYSFIIDTYKEPGNKIIRIHNPNALRVTFAGSNVSFEKTLNLGEGLMGPYHTDLNFILNQNGGSVATAIRFKYFTTTLVSIMQNGNMSLGMGNTVPAARLHVKGLTSDATTSSLKIENLNGVVGLEVKNDNSVNVGGNLTTTGLITATKGVSSFSFNEGYQAQTPTIYVVNSNLNGRAAALLAGTVGSEFVFENGGWFGIASEPKANFTGNSLGGGTVHFCVQNNGNIGIGLGSTGAAERLEVRGNIRVSGSTANRNVKITDTGIYMSRVSDGAYVSSFEGNGDNTYSARHSHTFKTVGTTKFKIWENGTVGIGTGDNAVTETLEVAGNIKTSGNIKLSGTTLETTPVNGTIETDGVNLYFTVGGVRKQIAFV